MNKIFLFLQVFYYSAFAMVPSCHAAVNLAKGKQYTVSPKQNYPLSAARTDRSALTDGAYTLGNFWTRKTTVGWQKEKMVEILIDLEQDYNIASIVFSSARGKAAGVNYPAHIAAFVGPDLEHLTYVGDLADDLENQPGTYQTKRFKLNNVELRGRYVLLEVIPNGVFLFCDEIAVIEGKNEQRKPGNLTVEKAREFTELFREKELLGRMAENLASVVDQQSGISRLHEIKQQITRINTASNAEAIEAELLALRGLELIKKISKKTLHVQIINPWIPLNPVSPISDTASTSISLLAPKYGYDSGAFLVTNLARRSLQITAEIEKFSVGASLWIYQVPFVKSAKFESVADPLVPVTTGMILRPGESRMFFVTVSGTQTGNWNTELRITSDDTSMKLPINIQIANVELPKKLSINSVNWGYLDFKLIRDRQQAAVADLLSHHTNVVVVPPQYMPNAEPIKPMDFSRLVSYLESNKGADRVLLFMNLRTDSRMMLGGGYPFLGASWKTAVKRWYEGVRQVVVQAGFKAEQIYWYPFDEMRDKEIDQFIALAKWARSAIPGVRFYATLGLKNSERALPYVDIAQIIDNDNELKKFTEGDAEKWLYDTKGPAKSLSPYSYYRLMAWKAFLNGYTGIGFWAFADAGWGDNPGTAWDDFDGKYPDFSVVYEGIGATIISSRRWEGWRMGIEDYELLTIYAKDKGDVAAKAFAKLVLDEPENTSIADEVRRKILQELSK